MSRFKQVHRLSKTRLNLEWLEGREVLSPVAGLSLPAGAVAHGVREVVPDRSPAAVFHHVEHEVPDYVVDSISSQGQVIRELEREVRGEIRKVSDDAPNVPVVSALADDLLDETDKAVHKTVKETIKLSNAIVRSETVTTVRDLVQNTKHEAVRVVDEALGDVSSQLPEVSQPQLPSAGGDQTQLSVKPKVGLGGAMLDLTLASSRLGFAGAPGQEDSTTRIDAGRLGHVVDTDEATEDSGVRLFAKDELDGLDLFLSQKAGRDTTALAFSGLKDASGEESLYGTLLDSSLSNGPILEGTAFENAIARFFAQLDALGRDLVDSLAASGLAPWIVGLSLGMASMELARRRVQLRRTAWADTLGWAPGLPLPGADR